MKLETYYKNLKIFLIFFAFYFLFSISLTSAAKLELISPVSEIGVGQSFYIDLMLDTEGADINAVQGIINFSSDILKFESLNDGDSIITFWAEKPIYKDGIVSFSGVIPGGFKGVLSPYYQGVRPGKILRLYFIAKAEGDAIIKLTNAKTLLNDGQGTEAPLTISNFKFLISPSTSSGQVPLIETKDIESPEDFKPEIVSDPDLFSGKNALVWTAKDKGSGIDYYQVAEQRGNITQNYLELPWQTTESPYILKDQTLKSYIYVKAVDNAGNIRVVFLSPSYIPWYKKPFVDILIGLGLVVVLLLSRWLWKHFLKGKKH